MTLYDTKKLDKLSPEQKAQYQEFLKAFPHLASKMDTSRQLNTPVAQALKEGKPVNDDDLDLHGIEQEQRAAAAMPVTPKPIGEVRIDNQRASMLSLDQENKIQEERLKQRLLKEQDEAAERIRRGEAPKVPPKEFSKFSPIGKKHPVLQRMRASLGMDELEKSETITVQGISYSLTRLTREDIAKVVSVASLHNADEINVRTYMETAIVAYAVKKIDGMAIADVFEIPYHELKITTGKDTPLREKERQDKGAQMFFEFLVTSPTEMTDTLVTFYEQNFPPVSLVGGESLLALCPEENCNYKAIIAVGSDRYCPHHGKPLRGEDTLPNPS